MRRLALVLVVVFLPACRGSGAACGAPVQDQLDSRSTQHLFPGAPEPRYATDPPTSGPHRLGNHPTGVLDGPIDRPRQVAMLENGAVLLQWRGLSSSARRELEGLAGGPVTVAPNASLKKPVVATAWTWKLSCSRVDSGALRKFVAAHAGRGAGHP